MVEQARALAEPALDLARLHNAQASEARVLQLVDELAAHRESPVITIAEGNYHEVPAIARRW